MSKRHTAEYGPTRLAPLPRTHRGTVYIPLTDPETGKFSGREAQVDISDGDLAAYKPWHGDDYGVYAVTKFLGTPLKVYMHDIVLARHNSHLVAISGVQELTRDGDEKAPTICICLAKPEEVGGLYTLRTQGLDAIGHREFMLKVPGVCVDPMCGSLGELANLVLSGACRFEPGQTVKVVNTSIGFVEVPGDSEEDPPYLQIVEVTDQAMGEELGSDAGESESRD